MGHDHLFGGRASGDAGGVGAGGVGSNLPSRATRDPRPLHGDAHAGSGLEPSESCLPRTPPRPEGTWMDRAERSVRPLTLPH